MKGRPRHIDELSNSLFVNKMSYRNPFKKWSHAVSLISFIECNFFVNKYTFTHKGQTWRGN